MTIDIVIKTFIWQAVYIKHQKRIFHDVSIIENYCHRSVSFVKGFCKCKVNFHVTSTVLETAKIVLLESNEELIFHLLFSVDPVSLATTRLIDKWASFNNSLISSLLISPVFS